MNIFSKLNKAGLLSAPPWIEDNLILLTAHGSHAYQVNTKDSDFDVYGIVIPPKSEVFFTNDIIGFGRTANLNNRFRTYQQHHIINDGTEYDFNIINIVDFFHLAMNCNPNWLEVLFTNFNSIFHITSIGKIIRDNRQLFLSKKVYYTMTNYAFSQIKAAKSKERIGKRKEVMERLGYCPKMLYHCARLIDQAEQILLTGDLELGKNKEYLKAIRREEVSYDEVVEKFHTAEKYLKKLYEESTAVPNAPDEGKIKDLLLRCLEHHYGNLSECVVRTDGNLLALREIDKILSSVRKGLYE